MDYDHFLGDIGSFGPFQIRMVIYLSLSAIPNAMSGLGYLFWAARPEHLCVPPQTFTQNFGNLSRQEQIYLTVPTTSDNLLDECYIYDINYSNYSLGDLYRMIDNERNGTSNQSIPIRQCHEWIYDKRQYTSTIVSKWNLVCDNKSFRSSSQAIFLAAFYPGSVLAGFISDRYGRRMSVLVTTYMQVIINIVQSFSPNIYFYIVCRFISGVGSIASYIAVFILVTEIVGPRHRTLTANILQLSFSLGYCLTCLVAYFIRDAFHLQLVLSVPAILLVFYQCTIVESPRWLFSLGRNGEAVRILEKIATTNGKTFTKETIQFVDVTEPSSKIKWPWVMFKHPNLRRVSCIVIFIWISTSAIYWGISLLTTDLGTDPYLTTAIAGFVELPATLWSYIGFQKCGRTWPLMGTLCLGGVAFLASVAVSEGMSIIATILAMVGKFSITAVFSMIYIYTTEVAPTPIRSQFVGLCSLLGRLGSVVSPYSADLNDVYNGLPLVIFAILCISTGLLVFLLPNTWMTTLPQTVEDADILCRLDKPCVTRKRVYSPPAENIEL